MKRGFEVYINDVLKYCKEHGKPMTRMGIYTAGKKNGFVFKVEGKYQYVFDTDKFLEWFKSANEEVPEGYISVRELKDRYNISFNKAYQIAKSPLVNPRMIGAGKGVIYVDAGKAEELIERSRNNHTYDWGR